MHIVIGPDERAHWGKPAARAESDLHTPLSCMRMHASVRWASRNTADAGHAAPVRRGHNPAGWERRAGLETVRPMRPTSRKLRFTVARGLMTARQGQGNKRVNGSIPAAGFPDEINRLGHRFESHQPRRKTFLEIDESADRRPLPGSVRDPSGARGASRCPASGAFRPPPIPSMRRQRAVAPFPIRDSVRPRGGASAGEPVRTGVIVSLPRRSPCRSSRAQCGLHGDITG